MNNLWSIFDLRRFLAAIFIINSGIAIGLTNVSASASVLVSEPGSVTYDTASGPQTVTSNEVYLRILPSPSPQTIPPAEIQSSPNPSDAQ